MEQKPWSAPGKLEGNVPPQYWGLFGQSGGGLRGVERLLASSSTRKTVPTLPGEPPRPRTVPGRHEKRMRWGTSKCSKGLRSDGLGPPNGVSAAIQDAIIGPPVQLSSSRMSSPRSRRSWHEMDAESTSISKWNELVANRPTVKAMLGAVPPPEVQGPLAFNGVWASRDDGEIQGQILGMELIWTDGSSTPLHRHGEHGLSMVVDNEAFTGILHEGRIKWCDGDVWVRPDCPSESMLQSEPVMLHRNRGLFRNWQPQSSVGAPLIPMRQRRPVDEMFSNLSFKRERKCQYY